jgi:aspartyl/asparaginyl beta-hydroxylase (cupin superfamily)
LIERSPGFRRDYLRDYPEVESGKFIEENCALCPQTASLLRGLPGVYTAFFSILDPHQYVSPHWGYYKGFLRYHLGVVIPNDNEDSTCFLRVNDDVRDNAKHDTSLIKRGLKYYWREGQGVLFDDTFLHDAANDSDEVRIVLWLDVVRRMCPRGCGSGRAPVAGTGSGSLVSRRRPRSDTGGSARSGRRRLPWARS